MNNRIDQFTHKILGFLKRSEAREAHSAENQVSRSVEPSIPSASSGEPQEVCRVLDKSEDIAAEYAKPVQPIYCTEWYLKPRKVSGAGNSTKGEHSGKREGKHPAPEGLILEKIDQEYRRDFNSRAFGKFLHAFGVAQCVDEQGCETVIDENCYGEQVCKRAILGICENCGQRVCSDCEKYETCCCAPKGTSRHRVNAA